MPELTEHLEPCLCKSRGVFNESQCYHAEPIEARCLLSRLPDQRCPHMDRGARPAAKVKRLEGLLREIHYDISVASCSCARKWADKIKQELGDYPTSNR